MVLHAVIPTKVLPAPHGNTMIPDLPRLNEIAFSMLKSAERETERERRYIPCTEHLTQALLLVGPNGCRGSEVDFERRCFNVSSKVVLVHQWISQRATSIAYTLCVFKAVVRTTSGTARYKSNALPRQNLVRLQTSVSWNVLPAPSFVLHRIPTSKNQRIDTRERERDSER